MTKSLREQLLSRGFAETRQSDDSSPPPPPMPRDQSMQPDYEGLQALRDDLMFDLTMFSLHQWPNTYKKAWGTVRSSGWVKPYLRQYASEKAVRELLDVLDEEFPSAEGTEQKG